MSKDNARLTDMLSVERGKGQPELLTVRGLVVAELRDIDGYLIGSCAVKNIVTAIGNQYYAGRAALSTGLPAQVTGQKLGTGSTTPSSTGSGAALATYLSGSQHAIDGGFPTASGGVVTWKTTYAAGQATTASAITETVLVTDTLADATSTAANTISRALLTGIASKQSTDTLTITWTHTLLGS